MRRLSQFLPDGFTLGVLVALVLAAFLPCRGEAARLVGIGGHIAIAVLFFLQGVRLSRQTVLAGMLHWRLHLVILTTTFVAFPLAGLVLLSLFGPVLAPPLHVGLLFLCCLPSTVQASVVFTSLAGGNVAAALCSASLSSILGVVLTPVLAGLLLHAQGATSLSGVASIALNLLLPFLLGQAVQGPLGPWMKRHQKMARRIDIASVLLVVYGSISAATLSGMWSRLPLSSLLVLVAIDAVLLAVMLSAMAFAARRLGFAREDEIAIVFCGAQKSLVNGIPMANALFSGVTVGFVVLPLTIYMQLQFMTCAALARRYAASERRRVLQVGG